MLVDGRLLAGAQERTNLVSKILVAEEQEQKRQNSNRWFLDKAEEAGIELDDNMLEPDNDASLLSKTQQAEAERAKKRLKQLLAHPMVVQRHKKFLTPQDVANKRSKT